MVLGAMATVMAQVASIKSKIAQQLLKVRFTQGAGREGRQAWAASVGGKRGRQAWAVSAGGATMGGKSRPREHGGRVCAGLETSPAHLYHHPSPNTMMQVEAALMETKRNIIESSPLTEGRFGARDVAHASSTKHFVRTNTYTGSSTPSVRHSFQRVSPSCFASAADRHAGGVCGARVRGCKGRSEGHHGRA